MTRGRLFRASNIQGSTRPTSKQEAATVRRPRSDHSQVERAHMWWRVNAIGHEDMHGVCMNSRKHPRQAFTESFRNQIV